MKISAVVVSLMDHPLGEVVDSIAPHVDELIVVRGLNGVWQRWEAVSRAEGDVIYTQDDDAVVDVAAVLREYCPDRVTCNMPADHRRDYPDGLALVGWGCVFSRRKKNNFYPYLFSFGVYPLDEVFRRECDRVFTGLSPLKLIDVPVRHLAHAHGADRMGREARHGEDLKEIRRRIYAIRAAK